MYEGGAEGMRRSAKGPDDHLVSQGKSMVAIATDLGNTLGTYTVINGKVYSNVVAYFIWHA